MRVVLDSNVLVSALATRGLCADVLRVTLAEHELIVFDVILEEVVRTLERKLRMPEPAVAEVEAFLRGYSRAAMPGTRLTMRVRDPADAAILMAAIAAEADVLVSGDRDLLDVRDQVDNIQIVDPRGFQSLIRRA